MKKIVILGSTGSVGTNGLDVIARHKKEYKVVALAAHSNVRLLARQIKLFKPRLAVLADGTKLNELRSIVGARTKLLTGEGGLQEAASMKEADIVLVAMSGTESIKPLLAAVRSGKKIALANKESIVSAGKIIMNACRTCRSQIIPVDSEHNSIFQCINGKSPEAVKKIYLMGSGGPLKDIPENKFNKMKLSKILAHPVWKMGRKISVDSATMMNKGLEIIEASHLFNIDTSKIEVLLHPEAIIHSMVEFEDGNIMANLFYPDMRLPIFYAFNYPKRIKADLPAVNIMKMNRFTFERPDYDKFPALKLSYATALKGGTNPACLNAANDEAVSLYLKEQIRFTDIVKITGKVLFRHKSIAEPSLDEILNVDAWARKEVNRLTIQFAGA